MREEYLGKNIMGTFQSSSPWLSSAGASASPSQRQVSVPRPTRPANGPTNRSLTCLCPAIERGRQGTFPSPIRPACRQAGDRVAGLRSAPVMPAHPSSRRPGDFACRAPSPVVASRPTLGSPWVLSLARLSWRPALPVAAAPRSEPDLKWALDSRTRSSYADEWDLRYTRR